MIGGRPPSAQKKSHFFSRIISFTFGHKNGHPFWASSYLRDLVYDPPVVEPDEDAVEVVPDRAAVPQHDPLVLGEEDLRVDVEGVPAQQHGVVHQLLPPGEHGKLAVLHSSGWGGGGGGKGKKAYATLPTRQRVKVTWAQFLTSVVPLSNIFSTCEREREKKKCQVVIKSLTLEMCRICTRVWSGSPHTSAVPT